MQHCYLLTQLKFNQLYPIFHILTDLLMFQCKGQQLLSIRVCQVPIFIVLWGHDSKRFIDSAALAASTQLNQQNCLQSSGMQHQICMITTPHHQAVTQLHQQHGVISLHKTVLWHQIFMGTIFMVKKVSWVNHWLRCP